MSEFSKSRLVHRYRNDNAFNQVVKTLEAMIHRHGFTPSELREALFLAHYNYEMENPSKCVYQEMNRLKEFWDAYNVSLPTPADKGDEK